MKTAIGKTCVPLAMVLAASAQAQETRANLVSNPSFAEGAGARVKDWAFWGWAPEGVKRTSRGVWDREVGRTDSLSLKVVNESRTDVGTWDNRHSRAFIPVSPGQVYTVSVYMRAESADPVLRTSFRAGFCRIGPDGKVAYFGAEQRTQVKPEDACFREAGVWKRLALAAFVPAGATHLGMDIDFIGKGTGWIDDVQVTEGYDRALLGKEPGPTVTIKTGPALDPPTPETPLSVVVRVMNPFSVRQVTLECEIVDYYFRPSIVRRTLDLNANESREVEIPFGPTTCARLFTARTEADANFFQITATLKEGGQQLSSGRKHYYFKSRTRDWGVLPPLPPRPERIDDLFGEQTLVDVIHCYDPKDPHPYFEGGRGFNAKTTGAVPQIEWKELYREKAPHFTTIDTILGRQFRVTHGWGWFAYKLNRAGLKPHAPYLVVLEYPEDRGRTYTVFNTGMVCSLYGGYGFHTGKTLGDHWTRTLNSEYTDYPLSGEVERWFNVFHLGEKSWAPGSRSWGSSWTRGDTRDGFWLIVGGVGPSQDALAAGAAVRTIKLYELRSLPELFPRVDEPPLELGRRELFITAESDGVSKFFSAEPVRGDLWARYRLHDAQFLGVSGLSPNNWNKTHWEWLMRAAREEHPDVKLMPRVMIERDFLSRIGVPPEALAKNAHGGPAGRVKNYRAPMELADILHPATLRSLVTLITESLGPWVDYPQLRGMMLYRHYGESFPVSFSEYALRVYEQETGVRIQGADAAARREWVLAQRKGEYYQWWYRKKRDFLLAIRDHLQNLRPDLDLYYFPWHSDDDFPFGVGRLRYTDPMKDKIYVPGTNILLVPGFTTPPEQWTPEQRKHPFLARHYHRERIAPHLEGEITIEDLLYGRYKDRSVFWGAPRSGELPHLLYAHEMDLIAMFTEPGGVYAHGVGYNPRLYRKDKGFIYWAPVRYRFTADNPRFLDLFRTGEGTAVAVHMPYNEETSHANLATIHGAHGVEHGGPFCMMEEVLSMAHSDPFHIMESMWEPLKRGFPQYARAFARAYRALPARQSEVLANVATPADEAIVVRSYETDYGHYLAVINRAFDLRKRPISLTLKPAVRDVAEVIDLGAGQSLSFTRAPNERIKIPLVLEPMSVTSLRIVDRTPPVALRDISVTPDAVSPNGDGVHDTIAVTGRTVRQITSGRWRGEVRDDGNRVVRAFEGDIPDVRFAWDGMRDNGERCTDGIYEIRLLATAHPDLVYRREVAVDTTPPDVVPILDAERLRTSANNVTVKGRIPAELPAGSTLYLRVNGAPEKRVPVLRDASFACNVEGLNLDTNRLELVVRDRTGNATAPRGIDVHFGLDLSKPVGFDFGAGPIMEGFSAIRNETHYSEERGYGWIDYDVVWKGDRGVGDHLLRDYCSGKSDREWAVRLPNGQYRVTVIMVDMRFAHHTGDLYIEGQRVHKTHGIKAGKPARPVFDVEVADGLLNIAQENPGNLPYFALTAIVIERK